MMFQLSDEYVRRRLRFAGELTRVKHWTRLLKLAGLPADRYHKTHALRRSHASHLAAAGVDASRALGHSSPLVTYEHYLDPAIVGAIDHGDRLPDPTRLP